MSLYSVRKQDSSPDLPDRIHALQYDWVLERPDLDTNGVAIVGRILMLGTVLQSRAADVLKPHGLQYSDFNVLSTPVRDGKPHELTPTDLMNAVVLSSGAMTALLDQLTRRGMISRRQSHADGRIRPVPLTSEGHAVVNETVVASFADAAEAVSCLDKRERIRLADMLRDMCRWRDKP